MKKSVLIFGTIIILAVFVIVLSGCSITTDTTSPETNDTVAEETETQTEEEVMNDYTFRELSFKLPSGYGETDENTEDTAVYTTIVDDKIMKVVSFGVFSAEGIDFVEDASESLAKYEFKLAGYEIVSKLDPKKVEFNGIPAIVVDVNYNNASVNGNGEVEYCYAQKGDDVYVICFEIFTQNGEKIEESDFSESFDSIKSSFEFAE